MLRDFVKLSLCYLTGAIRMNNMRFVLAATLISTVVVALTDSAFADLLIYEPFDYPAGTGNLGSDGGYGTHGGNVVAGSLSYPGLEPGTGNKSEQINGFGERSFPAGSPGLADVFTTAGTYYITGLMNANNTATRAAAWFRDGTTVATGFGDPGAGGQDNPILFVIGTNGDLTTVGVDALSSSDTHMFAIRVINDGTSANDDVRLVINPTLPDEPDWDSFTAQQLGLNITAATSGNPRVTMSNPAHGNGFMDEFRVSDTWAEAAPETVLSPIFTWNVESGDWNVLGNWSSTLNAPPNTPNETAVFANSIGSHIRTVYNDVSVTVNSIHFENTQGGGYRIAGGANINLAATTDGTATAPSIRVSQGTHEFQTHVQLQNDTSVDVASGAILEFDNLLSLNGNSLTKTGTGQLRINNDLVTNGGTVSVTAGGLGGEGVIAGDVINRGGAIAPGGAALSPAAVPEPSSLFLLLMGLVPLACHRWQSNNHNAWSSISPGRLLRRHDRQRGIHQQGIAALSAASGPSSDNSAPQQKVLIVMCLLSLLGWTSTAHSELLFYEGFDYTVGSDGGYLGAEILAGSLHYQDLQTSGNQAQQSSFGEKNNPAINQMFAAAGTYYITWLFNAEDESRSAAWFRNDGSIVAAGHGDPVIGDANEPILFTQNFNGSDDDTRAAGFAADLGQAHLYAVRVINDGSVGVDDIRLIVDPDLSLGIPDFDGSADIIGDPLDITNNNAAAARLALSTPNGVPGRIDEVRLGTTWEDVTVGNVTTPPGTDFTWMATGSGDWHGMNWTPVRGAPPNTPNHKATFSDSIGNNIRTVVADDPVTINSINFENTLGGGYRIAGGASIQLVATTAVVPVDPSISVSQGTHEFQANVALQNDTGVDVANGAMLEFDNLLTLNGNTLSKTGDGSLRINNDLNTGGGTVVATGGSLGGGGTVGGNLANNGASITPGNRAGTLTVMGDFSQTAGNTDIELFGSGNVAGTDFDRLAVDGIANLAGQLNLLQDTQYNPTLLDTMTGIVQAETVSGTFDTINGSVISGQTGFAVTYTSQSVDITVALRGNTDVASGDMDVDTSDLTTSIINFTSAGGTGKTWADGDMDGDGDVDTSDLTTSIINFTGAAGGLAAVPEPTSGFLMLLGSLALGWIVTPRGSPMR